MTVNEQKELLIEMLQQIADEWDMETMIPIHYANNWTEYFAKRLIHMGVTVRKV